MMTLSPGGRKLSLTLHITASVGWLGAVISYLVLAVMGLFHTELAIVRAAYVGMATLGWMVIIPLCLAALTTGLILSLGTPWGLFRHYWIVVKLAVSIASTILLLVHLQPIDYMAGAAAQTTFSGIELRQLRVQLVIDAGVGLMALLFLTALSVYKPAGQTAYGWRKQQQSLEVVRREHQPLIRDLES